MPSYVILTSFIRTGIENVGESPDRTEDAIELIELVGGELREFFVVMGRYDGVLIADSPVDETAARAVFALDKSGSLTTGIPFNPVFETRPYLPLSFEETFRDEPAWFAEAVYVPERFA